MRKVTAPVLALLALALGNVVRSEPLCRDNYDVATTATGSDPEALCYDGEVCTLRSAINTAVVCASTGPKTVLLPPGAVFDLREPDPPHPILRIRTLREEARVGTAALPRIFGTLTIRTRADGAQPGAAATIRRAADAPTRFRLVHVPAGGVLTLDGVVLENGATLSTSSINEHASSRGAGIYNEGRLILRNTAMTANKGTGRGGTKGGAVYNAGYLQTLASTFTENRAEEGAAVYNADGEVEVRLTTMASNHSSGVDGLRSSVVMLDGGRMTISSSTLDGNDILGAPVLVMRGGLAIEGTTISNNSGGQAGALDVIDGEALIRRSTLDGNSGSSAGAVACITFSARIRLVDATITNNRVVGPYGIGGVQASCAVEASNTVVARNAPVDCGLLSVVAAGGVNVDSDGTCLGFAFTAPEPQLGPLAANGGSTLTRLPARGSPLINMGTACERTDQRGHRRGDGRCDVGAVERGPGDGLPRVPWPRGWPHPIGPLAEER